jgi:hypothetical protein
VAFNKTFRKVNPANFFSNKKLIFRREYFSERPDFRQLSNCFLWEAFRKIKKVGGPFFGYFSHGQSYMYIILTKMGCATLWAIF